MRATFCQSIGPMALVNVEAKPPTQSRHLREGIGRQLRFCRQWAIERFQAAD